MALFLFFASPFRIASSRSSAEVVTGVPEFQVHALEGETSREVGLSGPGTYCTALAKTEEGRGFRQPWSMGPRTCDQSSRKSRSTIRRLLEFREVTIPAILHDVAEESVTTTPTH